MELGEDYTASGNQFDDTCGYYTQVEWTGKRGLYIEMLSDEAVAKSMSMFAMMFAVAILLK